MNIARITNTLNNQSKLLSNYAQLISELGRCFSSEELEDILFFSKVLKKFVIENDDGDLFLENTNVYNALGMSLNIRLSVSGNKQYALLASSEYDDYISVLDENGKITDEFLALLL